MTATEQSTMNTGGEARALRSALIPSGAVPRRILLAPWGRVESTNGAFVVDDESVKLVLEAFDEHATDLPIDYEHQTLGGTYSSPDGRAPAAGWVKRITGEPGVGLVAEIEWTPQAEELLASKQYRYLSPVAIIRKSDRKLVAIHSAALTNKPAIVGMAPIVNRSGVPRQDPKCSPLEGLRAELDVDPDAAPEEVLVAAGRRLAELQRESKRRQAEQRIREAMRAGKLVEAQRAWAEEMIAREEELFDAWFRTAPVIVMPGRIQAPETTEGGDRLRALSATARSEYRSNRMLQGVTSEKAYVADALRQAGY